MLYILFITTLFELLSYINCFCCQAKDNNVLFAVLALIRRDPVFGTGSSRVYSREYASPQVTFPTAKLVQMLPMLFHARFDPNNTVRPVMRALWDALMQRHFPQQQHMQLDLVQRAVVSYLCQKLHSPQWRDREAACLALEAFLPRRSWQVSVFPLLEQLFHSALRVLDDMRDSTRTAAIAFTKVLLLLQLLLIVNYYLVLLTVRIGLVSDI